MKKSDARNSMLNILIAEDSVENIATLKLMMDDMPLEFGRIDVAKTLMEVSSALSTNVYDLALLDIQFKRGTIFHVLEEVNEKAQNLPALIFITAHGSFDYATKAIQFACLDFLNKPLKYGRLLELIQDVDKRKTTKLARKEQLSILLDLIEGDLQKPTKIGVIRTRSRVEYIKFENLVYIKANGTTSYFYLEDRNFESVRHLGYYIELFNNSESIIQISRSCIVNKEHIKSFNSKERKIELMNGEYLSVSVRASKNFRLSKERYNGSFTSGPIEHIKKLLFGNNS